jgi:hypothetical protein
LEEALKGAGLTFEDGGALGCGFVWGSDRAPGSVEGTVAAAARRRFIARRCSPQQGLSLAACLWAAQQMGSKVCLPRLPSLASQQALMCLPLIVL